MGFIDARDIADVAVHQLLAGKLESGPLILTGDEALNLANIAGLISGILRRPIEVAFVRPAGGSLPLDPNSFEGRAVAEFMGLIVGGAAAPLTDTVAHLLSRPARTVAAFLSEQLTAPAA